MKILVIEDDPKISEFIKIGLESNNFTVDVAFDSPIGQKLARSKKYEVIVLDIIIPGLSGFELCKKLRNAGIHTPVLILTSLNTLEDKLEGFESGADDYLVKPFSFRELLARIKALIRRNKSEFVKPALKADGLEMDSIKRKVKRDGKEINLTSTEYRILELMLENYGKVFDRVMIAEKIWGFTFNSGTNIIDVHINSLRKKIDRDFDVKLIRTKKGFGYMLTSEN